MELTNIQWELFDFVKFHHGSQRRKYTDEPYFTHLLSVAELLSQFSNDEMEVEIGLCHDLLERTACTKQEFALKLIDMGYDLFPRNKILKGVYDMTNLYSEAAYPMFNRKERKDLEAERMVDIESFSQTVKYAEIIINSRSIIQYDPEFAKIYVEEIQSYIKEMNEGNRNLYQLCCKELNSISEKILNNDNPGFYTNKPESFSYF